MAPRPTVSRTQHLREMREARAAAREEGRREALAEEQDKVFLRFMTDISGKVEMVQVGVTEIREDLRKAVLLDDAELLAATPNLLKLYKKEVDTAKDRRDFWRSWRGYITYALGIAVAVVSIASGLGFVPFHRGP